MNKIKRRKEIVICCIKGEQHISGKVKKIHQFKMLRILWYNLHTVKYVNLKCLARIHFGGNTKIRDNFFLTLIFILRCG